MCVMCVFKSYVVVGSAKQCYPTELMNACLSSLDHSYLTDISSYFLTQLCCYCLWLCQLPKADLWEGRLPDWVLLPLQTNMAPKSDMRYGPSAEGADFASTDKAHFRSQLWARIGTRYKLALSHLSLYFILHNVSPKLGEITLNYITKYFWDQRSEDIWQYFTFSIIIDV